MSGQELVIALEIPFGVFELFAAKILFFEFILLDHGAHGAIQKNNAFVQKIFKINNSVIASIPVLFESLMRFLVQIHPHALDSILVLQHFLILPSCDGLDRLQGHRDLVEWCTHLKSCDESWPAPSFSLQFQVLV